MQKSIKNKEEREIKFIEDTVNEVLEDFEERRKARLSLEKQWQINMNFLSGNQYVEYGKSGDIIDKDGKYFWSEKGVYNHIAPIMETRLAKLSGIKTDVSVRPKSQDDTDVIGAETAEKAIETFFGKESTKDAISKVNLWSETCGTGFYKVVWDNEGGEILGTNNGKSVAQGDVKIIAISPFEIFPDSLFYERVEDCQSIIHARVISVKEVKQKYGVEIVGTDVDVFDFGVKNNSSTKKDSVLKNAVIVIEKYERPTEDFPNGRLITVAGKNLLYYGELPYKIGENKSYAYPFIKQESISVSGSFFGASIIERLVPIQRAYNAVKNRKQEFLNRISNGVIMVEDGSIDIDELEEEGLAPGKILIYRQGAKEPEMLAPLNIPEEFKEEEKKLLSEFVAVSGVSDVSSSSENAGLSSGSALRLLIEQDNQRLKSTAEKIRKSVLKISKIILRLYAQFLSGVILIKYSDKTDKNHVYYLDKNAVKSDDVYFERDTQIFSDEEFKRDTVMKLLESGLLSDEKGVIRQLVKEKALSILGYSDLASQKGLAVLQEEKAKKENLKIRKEGMPTEEIDDDAIHIDEHLRYVFAEYDELTEEEKQRLFAHVKKHKENLKNKDKE